MGSADRAPSIQLQILRQLFFVHTALTRMRYYTSLSSPSSIESKKEAKTPERKPAAEEKIDSRRSYLTADQKAH